MAYFRIKALIHYDIWVIIAVKLLERLEGPMKMQRATKVVSNCLIICFGDRWLEQSSTSLLFLSVWRCRSFLATIKTFCKSINKLFVEWSMRMNLWIVCSRTKIWDKIIPDSTFRMDVSHVVYQAKALYIDKVYVACPELSYQGHLRLVTEMHLLLFEAVTAIISLLERIKIYAVSLEHMNRKKHLGPSVLHKLLIETLLLYKNNADVYGAFNIAKNNGCIWRQTANDASHADVTIVDLNTAIKYKNFVKVSAVKSYNGN